MQGLTQPTLLKKIFAEDGDKNTLPVDNTDQDDPAADPSEAQRADLTVGFPPITSERPENGGLPPERKDFNALGYLTTTYDYFYQAGGTFTYNATISTAIGGYPLGARLWYTDNNGKTYILRSTKGNNEDNFVTTPSYIGTSWVKDTATQSDLIDILEQIYPVGSIYIGTQATCPMSSVITGSTWNLVAANRALWTGDGTNGNTTIAAGLPNITGRRDVVINTRATTQSGALYSENQMAGSGYAEYTSGEQRFHASPLLFDASKSNSIYGSSNTVQPPSYVVNVWRRTA